eukprot:603127_1
MTTSGKRHHAKTQESHLLIPRGTDGTQFNALLIRCHGILVILSICAIAYALDANKLSTYILHINQTERFFVTCTYFYMEACALEGDFCTKTKYLDICKKGSGPLYVDCNEKTVAAVCFFATVAALFLSISTLFIICILPQHKRCVTLFYALSFATAVTSILSFIQGKSCWDEQNDDNESLEFGLSNQMTIVAVIVLFIGTILASICNWCLEPYHINKPSVTYLELEPSQNC